jgi:hypothetical protein
MNSITNNKNEHFARKLTQQGVWPWRGLSTRGVVGLGLLCAQGMASIWSRLRRKKGERCRPGLLLPGRNTRARGSSGLGLFRLRAQVKRGGVRPRSSLIAGCAGRGKEGRPLGWLRTQGKRGKEKRGSAWVFLSAGRAQVRGEKRRRPWGLPWPRVGSREGESLASLPSHKTLSTPISPAL